MELHLCQDCAQYLPATAFSRNARRPNGLSFYCRECLSRRQREGYAQRRSAAGASVQPTGRRVQLPPGFKRCAGCWAELPLDAFGRNRASRDGYAVNCRECHNQQVRESRAKSGGSRNYHLRRRYGMTVHEYDAMVAAQGGKCAACRERPAEHVDHDHDTGQVRGILCFTCNVALGNTGDDPGRLLALMRYLAAHGIDSPPAHRGTPVANSRRLDGVARAFRDEIGPGVWRLRVGAQGG